MKALLLNVGPGISTTLNSARLSGINEEMAEPDRSIA